MGLGLGVGVGVRVRLRLRARAAPPSAALALALTLTLTLTHHEPLAHGEGEHVVTEVELGQLVRALAVLLRRVGVGVG